MTLLRVPQDYTTLQDAANAAPAQGGVIEISGTSVLSAPGENQILDLRPAVVGKTITDLTIKAAAGPLRPVIDFNGTLYRGVRTGGATGVKWKDVVFVGEPLSGLIWDHTDGPTSEWEWSGISLRDMDATFLLMIGEIGDNMSIRDVDVDDTFSGDKVIDLRNTGWWRSSLRIIGVRANAHPEAGGMRSLIELRDVRGVYIDGVWVTNPSSYGIILRATNNHGVADVTIRSAHIVNPGVVGIHAGDLTSGTFGAFMPTRDVHVSDSYIEGAGRYGLEYENGVTHSSFRDSIVVGCETYSAVMAEETEDCVFSRILSRGTNTMSAHIYCKNSLRGRIEGCSFVGAGFEAALRVADDPDGPTMESDGVVFVNNEGQGVGMVYDFSVHDLTGKTHHLAGNVFANVANSWALVEDYIWASKISFEGSHFPEAKDLSVSTLGWRDVYKGDLRHRDSSVPAFLSVGVHGVRPPLTWSYPERKPGLPNVEKEN